MLAIGTWLLGTEPELVLKSRRVVPARLLQSGFRFEYSDWRSAAEELVRRSRTRARFLPSLPRGVHVKNRANATFTIKSWDEKPYSEGADLPKLTRAAVTKSFKGDVDGEGQAEYLMMYRADGSATFVGLERIVGKLGGKSGSFVLQRIGSFESGVAKESYSVIPGSGTGGLRGLRGEGTTALGHGNEYPFTLDYELA